MDLSTHQLFYCVCLLLLLSWVKCSDVEDCSFGDEGDAGDPDGEGYFRLFPGKPQGRVEIRCSKTQEWGTITTSGVRNIAIVAALICNKLGYGDGSQIQPFDKENSGGYGTVWNVTCNEEDSYIDDCTFTPTGEEGQYSFIAPTVKYWKHDEDLHVKCGARPVDDYEPENILTFILVDVATFMVLLGLIILSGFIVYRLLMRKVKSTENSKSASQATTPI